MILAWEKKLIIYIFDILCFQGAEDSGIACKLGFFLHIPFPPWDIFRLIPWSDEVLQGILGIFHCILFMLFF